ncbi:ankyrin-3-like [Microplitis mediator]|uniref:ankyrin-3-like n=1 Tax=Microplitis mediator TaxID=375433 RepID=UPI002554F767|nr:ankyrin-3-like [Microplitis mediator]
MIRQQTASELPYEEVRYRILQRIMDVDTKCKEESGEEMTAFQLAVKQQDWKLIDFLLKNNVDVDTYTSKCEPALFLAIRYGNVGLITTLIRHQAKINITYNDNTPLNLAVNQNNYAIAELLIRHGAEVNARTKKNQSPLHIAIEKNNINLVKLLIKNNANVNVVTTNDETALILSIKNEYFNLFKILLDAGAEVNLVNLPPLFLAVEKNCYKMTEHLIEVGADINIIYKNKTPLIIAVENENMKIVKLLIKNNVDINIEVAVDKTALSAAIIKGNFVIFKMLVDAIADLNSSNLLPLHLAVLQDNYEFTEYLISSGADVNSLDGRRQTPLHISVRKKNTKIINLLLKNDADVNAFDNYNLSPLKIALINGNEQIVELLLDKAEITVKKNLISLLKFAWKNSTFKIFELLFDVGLKIYPLTAGKIVPPLHMAVIKNNFEAFNDLINDGDDINGSFWGKTPLEIAVERENKKIIELLVKNKANVNLKNEESILKVAVEKDDFKWMRMLVDAGVDVDSGAILEQAIEENNYEIVEYVISNGAEINNAYDYGECRMTPLEHAVKRGYQQIVKLLIEYNVDVNHRSFLEPGCLITAIKNDNFEIFQLLLDAGADIHIFYNGKSLIFMAVDKNSYEITKHLINHGADVNTCFRDKTLLYRAVENENERIVELLINNKVDVNKIIKDKYLLNSFPTALYKAVEIGNLNIVKILINAPNIDVDLSGRLNDLPLHEAIRKNNYEITKCLIEHGANINTKYENPLNIAINNGNKEIVQLLIDNKVKVDNLVDSPFVAAVENNNFEILEILIHTNEAGVNPSLSKPPLHAAVRKNNYNMTEYLINKGARVNTSYDNKTPLLIAVRCQHREIVQLLIKNKADVDFITESGVTALGIAVENKSLELVKILLDAGANTNPSSSNPPLHIAIRCRKTIEIMKLLIKNKADVDFVTESGVTALGIAVEKKNCTLVKILLDSGADVNFSSDKGYLPLQLAIMKRNYQIAECLINRGANINALCHCQKLSLGRDTYDYFYSFTNCISDPQCTLLQFAINKNETAIVKLLIENKVDMRLVEKNDPLFMFDIAQYRSPEILELILSTQVNVNCIDTRELSCRETLLHAAVKVKYPSIEKVKLLLMSENFIDINALTSDGKSALHYAVDRGHVPTVNVLLNAGAKIEVEKYGSMRPFDYRSNFCKTMIMIHVVKLKAANLHLGYESLDDLSDGKFNVLYVECLKEVELMKKTKIVKTNLSYYDVITKGKHKIALGLCRTNFYVEIDRKLISLQFPLYGGMIRYRLDEARRRRQLLEKSNKFLSLVFHGNLSYDVITQIYYYLSSRDLKILSLRS